MSTPQKKPAKKPHNKQHDVRGASFLRIAKRLRANTRLLSNGDVMTLREILILIIEALEDEAKTVRGLR